MERFTSFGVELVIRASKIIEKELIVDINHYERIILNQSSITDFGLSKTKEEFGLDDIVSINAKFSIKGQIREAFNEKNWTRAYNKNDNLFKLKYGVKLFSTGFRKHELGKPIETYRKASIFWTRNPKLVNPMKEKRVWVQVAKNFEPFIRLSEEEVQHELFDFEENFTFKASELGSGNHKLGAEAWATWQKHDYTEPDSVKANAKEIDIKIN